MITSTVNVTENMFKQFAGTNLTTPLSLTDGKGEAFDVGVIFFRESSRNFAEATKERYPLISIQEYFPQFLDEWHNEPENVVKRFSLFKDTTNDGKFDTVSWIKDPFFMSFRFDVSTACDNFYQDKALALHFLQRFGKSGTLEFNIEPISGIADYVDYTVTANELERSDGIFETNYEFTLKVWLHITTVEEYSDMLGQSPVNIAGL